MNTYKIHEIQALSFYASEGVRLMGLIEDVALKGKMFHEVYPEIEQSFWQANDARSLEELRKEYRRLSCLHDFLTMDGQ